MNVKKNQQRKTFFVQKYIPPVLKTHRALTDTVEDYVADYGYLGPLLHAAVIKERQSSTSSQGAPPKPTLQITQVWSVIAAIIPEKKITSIRSCLLS